MKLDIGSNGHSPEGFIGLDKRELPGVQVVHNMEVLPWPFESESCSEIRASHILEHIKPWLTIDIFNEMWRILKPQGQAEIVLPMAGSPQFWQDPTHCNGFTEYTFQYFDPDYPCLYAVYAPRPWRIVSLETGKIRGCDNAMQVWMEKR